MGKLATTWELAKVSWGVLRADKELLLLPVVSAVCAILVSATLVVPLIIVPDLLSGGRENPLTFVLAFLFYFANRSEERRVGKECRL